MDLIVCVLWQFTNRYLKSQLPRLPERIEQLYGDIAI